MCVSRYTRPVYNSASVSLIENYGATAINHACGQLHASETGHSCTIYSDSCHWRSGKKKRKKGKKTAWFSLSRRLFLRAPKNRLCRFQPLGEAALFDLLDYSIDDSHNNHNDNQRVTFGGGRVVVESCTRKQHVTHTYTHIHTHTLYANANASQSLTKMTITRALLHSFSRDRKKKKKNRQKRKSLFVVNLRMYVQSSIINYCYGTFIYSLDTRTIGRTEWKVKRSRCFLFPFFFFLLFFEGAFFLVFFVSTSFLPVSHLF